MGLGFRVPERVRIGDLQGIPESWNMGLGGLVLDFPSLFAKGT